MRAIVSFLLPPKGPPEKSPAEGSDFLQPASAITPAAARSERNLFMRFLILVNLPAEFAREAAAWPAFSAAPSSTAPPPATTRSTSPPPRGVDGHGPSRK